MMHLAVELSCMDEMSGKEAAITENISSRGLRAITKRMWRSGTRLLIRLVGEDGYGQASVVYCQPLGNKRFAVGLGLSGKVLQLEN
jgi:hypothetical protein